MEEEWQTVTEVHTLETTQNSEVLRDTGENIHGNFSTFEASWRWWWSRSYILLWMDHPIQKWSSINLRWPSTKKAFILNWWHSRSENKGSGPCITIKPFYKLYKKNVQKNSGFWRDNSWYNHHNNASAHPALSIH